jgi:hypothetical protein
MRMLLYSISGGVRVLSHRDARVIAGRYLRERYPPDCAILFEEWIDDPAGWYFVANRMTPHLLERYIGDGGFYVDAHSGEILHFGSGEAGSDLIWWLRARKRGFIPGYYRLDIFEIYDFEKTATILDKRYLRQAIPELPEPDSFTIRKQNNRYLSKEAIVKRLQALPCLLEPLSTHEVVDLVDQFSETNCCRFTYAGMFEDGDQLTESEAQSAAD